MLRGLHMYLATYILRETWSGNIKICPRFFPNSCADNESEIPRGKIATHTSISYEGRVDAAEDFEGGREREETQGRSCSLTTLSTFLAAEARFTRYISGRNV